MKTNRTLGGALIIIGTTIGAGMLALPLVSAPFGFSYSTLILFIIWLIMSFVAFLNLEIYLCLGQTINIIQATKQFLGSTAEKIALFSFYLLLYALLSAYISAASSIFQFLHDTYSFFSLPSSFYSLSFTALLGLLIFSQLQILDWVNRILIIGAAVCLGFIIFLLLPYLQGAYLQVPPSSHVSFKNWQLITPIFITSFGFHICIPTIIQYVGLQYKALKNVFFIGLSTPFFIYLLWQLVILGCFPDFGNIIAKGTSEAQNVHFLITKVSQLTQFSKLTLIFHCFSILAISTSFLGAGVSLFHCLSERFFVNHHRKRSFKAFIWTIAPPLIIAKIYPKAFIFALSFAASMFCIVSVIFPALILLKMRKEKKIYFIQKTSVNQLGIYMTLIFGFLIIFMEILNFITETKKLL